MSYIQQKYYRGSAEIQSPCPAIPPRTFSFADDEEEVVSFKRPKSKRLSIEPWGPPDSPFSTFGKTPPKQLHTPNLPLRVSHLCGKFENQIAVVFVWEQHIIIFFLQTGKFLQQA